MEWSNPIYDEFYERFHPDAFRKSLRDNPEVYATIDHNPGKLLGRTGSGTLVLDNRDTGLYTECMNPGTSYANDLVQLIESGDVAGMSFTFRYKETGPPERHNGMYAITVMEADLMEVCFTFMPAYPTTDAGMRNQFIEVDDKRNYRMRRAKLLTIRTSHAFA